MGSGDGGGYEGGKRHNERKRERERCCGARTYICIYSASRTQFRGRNRTLDADSRSGVGVVVAHRGHGEG